MSAPEQPDGEERFLLPISALQHLSYCERRAALVHLDREWRENVFTAEGRAGHARVDGRGARNERRRGTPTSRRVVIWSETHALTGVADVVEYRRHGASDLRLPFPVEYKRGRAKRERAFEIQLCAQALCLEEMLGRPVPAGALLFIASKKRQMVEFTDELRSDCLTAIARAHELLSGTVLPPAEPGPKCRKCSMRPVCMPTLTDGSRSVAAYLNSAISSGE